MLKTIYSRDLPNLSKRIETLKQLVELKHSDSMISLGDYYLCQKNSEKARDLYNKAKFLNSPLAQVALDDLEIDGEPSVGCFD
jgi:predicted negative regulator of RcsB-dependent stress response